jgi:hypothetical protein
MIFTIIIKYKIKINIYMLKSRNSNFILNNLKYLKFSLNIHKIFLDLF